MRIRLDEKHYLNSDTSCCWVTVEVTSENGKSYDRQVSGYHRTFKAVVESYIEQKIRNSEATTIAELKDDIEELKETVRGWEGKA